MDSSCSSRGDGGIGGSNRKQATTHSNFLNKRWE